MGSLNHIRSPKSPATGCSGVLLSASLGSRLPVKSIGPLVVVNNASSRVLPSSEAVKLAICAPKRRNQGSFRSVFRHFEWGIATVAIPHLCMLGIKHIDNKRQH